MEARFTFAASTREKLLPFVENLPGVAGDYFDHQAGGELVILLTTADKAPPEKIRWLASERGPTRVESFNIHRHSYIQQFPKHGKPGEPLALLSPLPSLLIP